MNEQLASFLLDSGSGSEWWAFASSALVIVVAGIILTYFKLYLSRRTEAERLQRESDASERKRVAEALAAIGLQIAAEAEERRNSDAREAADRRDKDDALGRDLVRGLNAIQNAFSYYCGKMDEKRPRFDD